MPRGLAYSFDCLEAESAPILGFAQSLRKLKSSEFAKSGTGADGD
jgi:hypothetical protein